jgi:hypothetical protein
MSSKVIVMGDIHGNWSALNNLITKEKPATIIQCGDFGYWPNMDGARLQPNDKNAWSQSGMKLGDTKLYWLDGNHEDHWALKKDTHVPGKNGISARSKFIETHKRVYHMRRGAHGRLPNGDNALYMGGALSIDRHLRTFGVDWFPEETISNEDLEIALSGPAPDIVFSHTCPSEFLPFVMPDTKIERDLSCEALSVILREFRPQRWYFAHWHKYATGTYENCKWTCLNTLGEPNGWEYLY